MERQLARQLGARQQVSHHGCRTPSHLTPKSGDSSAARPSGAIHGQFNQ
jgi:hypothetical protein